MQKIKISILLVSLLSGPVFAEELNPNAIKLLGDALKSKPGEPGLKADPTEKLPSSFSKLMKPISKNLRDYYWAYGVVVAAASVYTTIKLYELGKIKAARLNSDSENPLRAKLAILDAQLDRPGLSNSDRITLQTERNKVLTELVKEYFKDKKFLEVVKEVATSLI